MHFLSLGLSYKTAPVEVREKLATSGDQLVARLEELQGLTDVDEGFLISTCNRVEAYLIVKHIDRVIPEAKQLFAKWAGESLDSYLYELQNGKAISQLFRVTSSLDSMIIGEPQITGQVKEAYKQATEIGSIGPLLNKLIHQAFRVSKKIRTETEISSHPVSVSYAAVVLAKNIFGSFHDKKVLLIGAGEMSENAASLLVERGIQKIFIANRTEQKSHDLVNQWGGTVVAFEKMAEHLDEVDIVITSTSAPNYLIVPSMVDSAMNRRKQRPIFFIDIAVPRNIDPKVNDLYNIYLYDIDDLQAVVSQGRKKKGRRSYSSRINYSGGDQPIFALSERD